MAFWTLQAQHSTGACPRRSAQKTPLGSQGASRQRSRRVLLLIETEVCGCPATQGTLWWELRNRVEMFTKIVASPHSFCTTPEFLTCLESAWGLGREHPKEDHANDCPLRHVPPESKTKNQGNRKDPYPEDPSTQYLRTLVAKPIKGMVFGTRILKYWVLGPLGHKNQHYVETFRSENKDPRTLSILAS